MEAYCLELINTILEANINSGKMPHRGHPSNGLAVE